MHRHAIVAAILAAGLAASPSHAVSSKDKEQTCKLGADAQGYKGAERAKFIKNCMANRDDPRGPANAASAAPK
jgi:hypothetical protein